MAKPPFKKLQHPDSIVNRIQGHVEEALNKLGDQTLDHWSDGTLFKRTIGVNFANQMTASGIAPYTIQSSNVASGTLLGMNIAAATVSGYNIAPASVAVSNLAPCNQVSVYRTTAFQCGNGARSPLIANVVLADVGAGYNTANGIYTLPAAGDWQFQWALGFNTMAGAAKQMFTALVLNSGEVLGGVQFSSGTNQYQASVGSYLYRNGLVGDTVALRVFNGDSVPVPMAVGSGANFFQGYQLR